MACEYPVCPCQRLCGFTGEVINPADSIHCHVHIHGDHVHVHVHAPIGDTYLDEEQNQRLAESHAHVYSERVLRYAPLGAYATHEAEWHDRGQDDE